MLFEIIQTAVDIRFGFVQGDLSEIEVVPGMGHDFMAPTFELVPVIKITHQFRADPFVHSFETGEVAGSDYIEAGFETIGFMDFCNPVKRFFKAVVETEA